MKKERMTILAIVLLSFIMVISSAHAQVFLFKWGTQGGGDGQFGRPHGVALDSFGNVYVADSFANFRVQKFDGNGNFLTKWGSVCFLLNPFSPLFPNCVDPDGPGPLELGDGQFFIPFSVAVDSSGHVYVTDTNNERIQKFASDGTFLTKWGSPGFGDGQFSFGLTGPGITVDASGHVYVANGGRIQKFSNTGTFILKWGTPGSNIGQFSSTTHGIAVDSSGFVYVADTGNHRIQKFDSNGNFIRQWGSLCDLSFPPFPGCIDPDGPSGPLALGDGQFFIPIGIAVDSVGHVYVVDKLNHRIQKFDRDGNFITKWGSNCQLLTLSGCVDPDGPGPLAFGDGQFFFPEYVGVDALGRAYVSDTFNFRIQVFGSPAVAITSLTQVIQGMGLASGITTSLTAKLDAAVNSLNRGNTTAAAHQLTAFIKEVSAQGGKNLTSAQADQLITTAQSILIFL